MEGYHRFLQHISGFGQRRIVASQNLRPLVRPSLNFFILTDPSAAAMLFPCSQLLGRLDESSYQGWLLCPPRRASEYQIWVCATSLIPVGTSSQSTAAQHADVRPREPETLPS